MYFESKLGYTPINYQHNHGLKSTYLTIEFTPPKKMGENLHGLIVSLQKRNILVFNGGKSQMTGIVCTEYIPRKFFSESLPLKSYRDPKGDYPPGNDHISQPVVRWLPLASFCLARIGWSWRAGNKEVDDHGDFLCFGTCGFLEAAGTYFFVEGYIKGYRHYIGRW